MTITKENLLAKFKQNCFCTNKAHDQIGASVECFYEEDKIFDFFWPYINSKEEKCCEKCINLIYGGLDCCDCDCHKESKLPSKLTKEENFDVNHTVLEKINEIISYLTRAEELCCTNRHTTTDTLEKEENSDIAENLIEKNLDLLKRIPLEDSPSPVPEWTDELHKLLDAEDKYISDGQKQIARVPIFMLVRNLLEREREEIAAIIKKEFPKYLYAADSHRHVENIAVYNVLQKILSAITSKDNK